MDPSQYQKLPRNFNPHQTFNMELSLNESYTLAKILPKGYSLANEPKSKSKIIKKNPMDEASIYSQSIQISQQKNIKTANSQIKKVPGKEIINETVKPCFKILEQLKGYKHAWPFLQPVDVQSLGIPQYYEIVKQPMDLSTVQKKLKGGKYLNPQAFYNDINKIIKNSYAFNQANEDFVKVTSDFQKYFFRIAGAEAKPVVQKKQQKKLKFWLLFKNRQRKRKKQGFQKICRMLCQYQLNKNFNQQIIYKDLQSNILREQKLSFLKAVNKIYNNLIYKKQAIRRSDNCKNLQEIEFGKCKIECVNSRYKKIKIQIQINLNLRFLKNFWNDKANTIVVISFNDFKSNY